MEHYRNKDSFIDKLKTKCSNVKKKADDALWMATHDERTQANIIRNAIVIGVVASTAITIKKGFTPTQAEYERNLREKTYYDPHTQLRYDVRRKLRNEEILYIKDRTKKGERAIDVLRDMGLAR